MTLSKNEYVGQFEINICPPDTNKGRALAQLKGIDSRWRRIVAFGDGVNDLEMLRSADFAVAMQNAGDLVKKSAHVTIGSNRDNAVIGYMEELMGLITD